jgi:hypothetical protein
VRNPCQGKRFQPNASAGLSWAIRQVQVFLPRCDRDIQSNTTLWKLPLHIDHLRTAMTSDVISTAPRFGQLAMDLS